MNVESLSGDSGRAVVGRPKVLVVDDRPENLLSLKRILADVEVEMIAAESGHEALAKILRHQFALILMDVMMPEMDGFETARLIRINPASQHVPIIFITAADRSRSYEDKGYELGAVDYLFKPVEPNILLGKVRVFLQLATQQQALAQSLEENRQLRHQHELLLSSVNEGILSLDLQGRISYANTAAAGLLGIREASLSGRSLLDFLFLSEQRQADADWLESSFCAASDVWQGRPDQYWFRHACGQLFPVELALSPLYEHPQRLTGRVLMFQDISERKEREALVLASKHKSAFLANVSHELRSPLHCLLMLARQLAVNDEGNLNAQQVKSAQLIQQEGQDLLRLINDILDLSKVEAGKIDLQWQEVNLAELIAQLELQLHPLVSEKGLAWRCQLSATLPVTLYTDRQRLQQILRNLLFNALKFTNQGSISLTISAAEHQSPAALAFAVTDTGIGIAPQQQAKIFDAFEQVDAAFNRHYEGSGLGLAICRQFCDLLGGYLSLDSEFGEGSCFTLYLPLQSASERVVLQGPLSDTPVPGGAASASTPPPSPERPTSTPTFQMLCQAAPLLPSLVALAQGKTLLLVDADMRYSFTLTQLLRRHGFRIIKADSYSAARATLERHADVALLIMAWMPQPQEADALLQWLRAHNRDAWPALMVLFDPPHQAQAESCLTQGAYACLPKDMEVELLLARLTDGLAARSEPGGRSAPGVLTTSTHPGLQSQSEKERGQ